MLPRVNRIQTKVRIGTQDSPRNENLEREGEANRTFALKCRLPNDEIGSGETHDFQESYVSS